MDFWVASGEFVAPIKCTIYHSIQLSWRLAADWRTVETIKNTAFEPVTSFIQLRPLVWENYRDIWVIFSRQKPMMASSTLWVYFLIMHFVEL